MLMSKSLMRDLQSARLLNPTQLCAIAPSPWVHILIWKDVLLSLLLIHLALETVLSGTRRLNWGLGSLTVKCASVPAFRGIVPQINSVYPVPDFPRRLSPKALDPFASTTPQSQTPNHPRWKSWGPHFESL